MTPEPRSTLAMRRYRRDDYDRVAELHLVAMRAAGLDVRPGAWDTDLATPEVFADTYLQRDGDFIVGEVDGVIVAMGGVRRFDTTRAEMKRVRVDPAHQRRGFGRVIVSLLEVRAVALGYRAMHLDTHAFLAAAIAMYRELGYEEIGRGDMSRFELVLMEKPLGRSISG